jgi:hypothetical protein
LPSPNGGFGREVACALMRARRGSGATAHGPRLLPGEAETMAGSGSRPEAERRAGLRRDAQRAQLRTPYETGG